MRKTVLFGFLCLALALVAVVFLRRDEVRPESSAEKSSSSSARMNARSAVREVQAASRRQSPKPPKPVLDFGEGEDDEDDKRTPAEKALAERIEKALDDEDFNLAVACADEAQKCGVTEIRQSMVETLGWFGAKALPELTPFLADADEDVRECAKNEWTMALSSIEDDRTKMRTVELALGVLRDEDALEEISGEFIGADEKLAVESLVNIIGGGGSKEGIAKAKETYEFVTGEEWESAEAAARWIAEEYKPPEGP